MFRLKGTASEPFWLEILPGQRTQFKPLTMAMLLVARQRAGETALSLLPKSESDPDGDGVLLASASGQVKFVVSIAQMAIVAWEGIGGADGNELEPTPEAIAEYMSDYRVFDAVRRLYIDVQLVSVEEKNASAPSQNGISGADKIIAKAARRSTNGAAKAAATS